MLFFNRIYFFILIFFCFSCFGQLKLEHFNGGTFYNKKNGLSSSIIGSIEEDKDGYLWLATGKGVTHFDGNYFTNYTTYYNNGKVVPLGYISSIKIQHRKQLIWLCGTNGIFYSSLSKIKFIKLNFPSFKFDRINDVFFENDSIVWLANFNNGISSFNLKNRKLKRFRVDSLNSPSNNITKIKEDSFNNNFLWLATSGGLIKFDKTTKKQTLYLYKNNINLGENKIRTLHVTEDLIFIGTYAKGLLVFNKHTAQFSQPNSFKNTAIGNVILQIYRRGNKLSISTSRGLFIYDLNLEKITNQTPHNYAEKIIRGISFIDSRGIIWYNTSKGLFKFDTLNPKPKYLELKYKKGLENNFAIKKIIRKKDFLYVIGHQKYYIYKVNINTFSFEKINITKSIKKENEHLKDMVAVNDEEFLILLEKSLVLFNSKNNKTSLFPVQLPHPALQAVVKDKKETIWLAGRNGGLYAIDKNLMLTNYIDEFNIYKPNNEIWINQLFIDSSEKLWIGKGSKTVFDVVHKKMKVLKPSSELITYQDALSFIEDKKGRIWVAGGREGIGYTNYSNFNKGITQVSNGYYDGVYQYNDSLLWTTGDKLGIFNINTLKRETVNIDNNGTYRFFGPIIPINKNRFVISCFNGLMFYTKHKTDFGVPKPYIREIVNQGEAVFSGIYTKFKEVKFTSNTKHLLLKTSAFGFRTNQNFEYKYSLNDEWVKLNRNNEIDLSNLSHGNYTFKLAAFKNNKLVSSSISTYLFSIPSPWYQTNIAYLGYLILFILIIFLIHNLNLKRKIAIIEKQKAYEIDGVKSTMYANVSHEFRTPLTIINGLSKELLQETSKAPIKEKLFSIHSNGLGLLQLTNQMLELTAFDANKVVAKYNKVMIVKFIETCVKLYKPFADSKNITLLSRPELNDFYMDVDEEKLQKIINNLLSNAIKFTPEKGIVIVKIGKKNNSLFFKIIDTGVGIKAQDIPYIFERYYKTFDTDVRQGSGIGMALTQELVKLLKGNITVESKPNSGSTFTITLPIKHNIQQTSKSFINSPVVPNYSKINSFKSITTTETNTIHILIVEDNIDIQKYLLLILGKLYTIHTANNGKEGIKLLAKNNIDLIISDVMMPEMDGINFCSHVKNDINTSHIPFIILSARAESKDKIKGYQLGIDAYLFKPFEKEELELIVKNLLEKKQKQTAYFSKLLNLKESIDTISTNQLDVDFIKNIQEFALHKKNTSLDNLTKELGMSRSHIHKKMKNLTGKSITKYINQIRIQKAKKLLISTELQINEIAFEVGFESANYFTRTFKQELGISPLSYRKNTPKNNSTT